MRRVVEVRAGQGGSAAAADRVVLDADDRQRRRIVLTSEKGTTMLLDSEKPVTLREGDALVLDDGSFVVVAGPAEPLLEVRAKTPNDFVRLAWHVGNRHTDAQFTGDAFRIRHDHVLEEMVRGIGGTITSIEAVFEPEPRAPHENNHDHE